MKLVMLFCILFTIQLTSIYADTYLVPARNFTFQEILANRIQQPLVCNYQTSYTDTSDSAISYFIKNHTNNSGLLKFLLFQEDSFSRDTYNYCINNLTGDVVFINFGKYANVSVNFKNAIMYSEFVKISIPYGSWLYTKEGRQVKH